uniref:SFRICE_021070 n=1 Tax=Spodoptera frugiperda TaxID=7108 RepID=A0A2H1W8W4_SPOFR
MERQLPRFLHTSFASSTVISLFMHARRTVLRPRDTASVLHHLPRHPARGLFRSPPRLASPTGFWKLEHITH